MAVRTAYPGSQSVGDVLTSANFTKLPGGWIGYAEVTANQTGITTDTALTGLTVTVTVGTSRKIRITGVGVIERTVGDGQGIGYIKEGATKLGRWAQANQVTVAQGSGSVVSNPGSTFTTPSAGSHTYFLTLERTTGTGTIQLDAAAGTPAYILVEDIGPAA
jgi:hypothetical protein